MGYFKIIRFENTPIRLYISTEVMQESSLITNDTMEPIMTCSISQSTPLPRSRLSLLARLHAVVALRRQRRALASLSDTQLKDIGLSRAEVDAEVRRKPWDAPHHWQG